MVMGARGVSGRCLRGSTAAYLLTVMAGSGFSSPLFQELREKRGLVYSYGFQHSEHSEAGAFYFSGSTSFSKTHDVQTVFLDVLQKVSRDAERLEVAKRRIEKALAMQDLELVDFVHYAADNIVEGGHAPFSLSEFIEQMRNITPDEIQALARTYLQPAHFTTVIVKSQNE